MAAVKQADAFLDRLEAQPQAKRKQYMKDHVGEVVGLPLVNPKVKERLHRLLGQ